MKLENLLEALPTTYNMVEKDLVSRAFHFAELAHKDQLRASGEPYITHSLAVGVILAELHVPPGVVMAGLLHDTVEDTTVTLDMIKREFGEDVAHLVDGVTKLTHLPRVSNVDRIAITDESDDSEQENEVEQTTRSRRKDLDSETLRKTFLAMGEDIRVVLIKLADRLHNMRTLGYMPESKRKRIAQETLDIFAPLANRLGIWQVKWELEDLAFRYVNPEKYKEIAENLAERGSIVSARFGRSSRICKRYLIKPVLKLKLQADLSTSIQFITRWCIKGNLLRWSRDLRAVRLIVSDVPSCYAALGVIHTHWRPIPHEFDDYIAAPKDNFYQSLHTAVIYDDGKPLEIQIRTPEMDQNAEFGIAAHWRYKEGAPRDANFDHRVNWLRRLMDWRQDVEDAQEFMDGMKTDVFQDRVYVFTPRGDIIDLPAGSTPIDFAYHVHTEIGHRCRGSKVNAKLVTLDYVLKTGDQVEILTAKQGGPSRDWLNPTLGLVKTARSRSKIKQWFKWQDRELNLSQGRLIIEKEFHRLGIINIELDPIIKAFELKNLDDLYVSVGCGDISLNRVIKKLTELNKDKQDELLNLKPAVEKLQKPDAVMVVGLKGLLTNLARCCNPVPGDPIVGYITRGRGATIHRQDCPNVLRLDDHERMIRVSWGEPQATYPVQVQIRAYDRQGLLADISNALNNSGIDVSDIGMKVHQNLAVINIVLEVGDIVQLSQILTRFEGLPNVIEAQRLRPG